MKATSWTSTLRLIEVERLSYDPMLIGRHANRQQSYESRYWI